MKRILAFILASLMAASVVITASCSDNEAKTPAVNDETTVSTPAVEEETVNFDELTEIQKRAYYEDDLPDVTYNSRDFRMTNQELNSEEDGNYYYRPNEEGEILNDAIYERNRKVEERFDVKIVQRVIPLTNDGFRGTIPVVVQAGDDFVDMIIMTSYASEGILRTGSLINLEDLEYTDLDAVWWNEGKNREHSILNIVFAAIGDMIIPNMIGSQCLMVNFTLGENYSIGSEIYQTVNDGNWTFEQFQNTVKGIYDDTNGNGEKDTEDIFGYISDTANDVDGWQYALGCPMGAIDEDGTPLLIFNTERTSNAVDKVLDLLHNTDGVYTSGDLEYSTMFLDGKSVFEIGYLSNGYNSSYRNMEDHYGFIPLPKYDENQEDYITYFYPYLIGVPVTLSLDSYEMVSVVMEALNIETYKKLYYTYYVEALQTKYTRDEESIEMIDIIAYNRTVDPGELYGDTYEQIRRYMRDYVKGERQFASSMKTAERKFTAGQKLIVKNIQSALDAAK